MRRITALLALSLAFAGCADAPTRPHLSPGEGPAAARVPGPGARAIPDQYVVRLREHASALRRAEGLASVEELVRGNGGRVMHVYRHAVHGLSVHLPEAAVGALRRHPAVEVVEPDLEMRAAVQSVSTGIPRTGADRNPGAKIDGVDDPLDVDIAILDSGIEASHPDLRVVTFHNCRDATNADTWGHGTHVAGIAGAIDNSAGVVGVAPGARLWAVKVLDGSGNGTLSSIICGIDYVTGKAAEIEVANMSLGGTGASSTMRSAIQRSVGAGVFYAVAAGNGAVDVYGADGTMGTSDDYIPAAYPEVATVSALGDSDGKPGGAGGSLSVSCGSVIDDSMACFSNYSRFVVSTNPVTSPGAAMDLAAPGVRILSTYPGGGTTYMDGTSMAAPHVAGAAALEYARRGTRDINGDGALGAADVYALRQVLIDGTEPQAAWRADGTMTDRDANREGLLSLAVVVEPVVSNLRVASGRAYQVVAKGLAEGAVQYIDRSHTFAAPVPSLVQGATYIQTANNDKSAGTGSTSFLSFDVDVDVAVYVAHDDRLPRPAWLGSFVDTGEDLLAQGSSSFSLFRKDFPAGTVTLGGNVDSSSGSSGSMYSVVVRARSGSPSLGADTQAPTVSISAPLAGATVSGTVMVEAGATDDRGVEGVRFQVDGVDLGAEDTGAPYQASWNTTAVVNGTHTLTAIARDAAGNQSTTSVSVTVSNTASGVVVSNLRVASGRAYQVVYGGLAEGAVQYIDRPYLITTPVPSLVRGETYIQTANDDKSAGTGSTSFLSFDVDVDVAVYVAHDDRLPRPAWLGSFTDTGEDLLAQETPSFSLFRKDFPAGTVTLGGNVDSTGWNGSMYTVVVLPRSGS